MKLTLYLLFLFSILAYSKVLNNDHFHSKQSDFIEEGPKHRNIDRLSYIEDYEDSHLSLEKGVGSLAQIIAYTINITIAPWETPNFDGILFTTQQFDGLFPTMKTLKTPYNVSFHILAPINPFTILNFSGYKLNVDFKAQITVLIPDLQGNKPWTTCNATGYLTLQLVDWIHGIRLYIKDYMVNHIIIPDSEKGKIDQNQVFEVVNSLGQLGIDEGNHLLSQKPFLMHGEGEESEEPAVFRTKHMLITVEKTKEQN